ncbi:MAG TPA: hypothetical protein VGJ54_13560 [Streptosporangiaceae bacterium]|jgi:hypothetical protein
MATVESDPDDPDDLLLPVSDSTRQLAALTAEQAHIALPATAHQRRLDGVAAYGLLTARQAPRPLHRDFRESTRERAERVKAGHPRQLRLVDDDLLPGELPRVTYS